MFKNRKMCLLKKLLIFFILIINSWAICRNKLPDYKDLTDTIYIKNKDLIIQNEHNNSIYKDLVIEGISVTTSLKTFENNIFYLIYEYNASANKMQYVYKFCGNENISLIYKEIVNLNKGKINGIRLYPTGYKLKDLSLDEMEHIGDKLSCSEINKTPLFFNKEKITSIEYDNYGFDYFINIEDYFGNKGIKKINIINVEKLNNLALQLHKYSAYSDSIFLLKKIIEKFPDRTVAYLNLADCYWSMGNLNLAKQNYKKYIDLMKSQKKDLNKIPK